MQYQSQLVGRTLSDTVQRKGRREERAVGGEGQRAAQRGCTAAHRQWRRCGGGVVVVWWCGSADGFDAVPGVKITLPALTEKDKGDLIFGCQQVFPAPASILHPSSGWQAPSLSRARALALLIVFSGSSSRSLSLSLALSLPLSHSLTLSHSCSLSLSSFLARALSLALYLPPSLTPRPLEGRWRLEPRP